MYLSRFTLFAVVGALVSARRRYQSGGANSWKLLQRDCEREVCRALVGDSENCVNFCKAPPCFFRVYGWPYDTPSPVSFHEAAAIVSDGNGGRSTNPTESGSGAGSDLPAAPPAVPAPLEAGELDRDRASAYAACVRELERALRRVPGGWPPSLDEAAGHLLLPGELLPLYPQLGAAPRLAMATPVPQDEATTVLGDGATTLPEDEATTEAGDEALSSLQRAPQGAPEAGMRSAG